MENDIEIIEKIGSGASSEVFRIKYSKFPNQDLAMKKINLRQLKNKKENLVKLIGNEIGILSVINHPNIVMMVDSNFTGDEEYCIYLEFCSGGNLQILLKEVENKGLDEKRAFEIMSELLSSISYLGTKNIIHKDLKPENILFKHNTAKISDFGFSDITEIDSGDTPQEYLGTPAYASPQILNQDKFSIKTDIWSLGVIFYQILFGVHPYITPKIKSLKALSEEQKTFDVRKLDNKNRDPKLIDILEGMLQFEEDQRWDIKKVTKMFEAFLKKRNGFEIEKNDLFVSIGFSKKKANNSLEDEEKQKKGLDELKKKKWVSNYFYYRLEVCAIWIESIKLLEHAFNFQEFLLMSDVYFRMRYILNLEYLLRLHQITKIIDDDQQEPLKSLKNEFTEFRKSTQFQDFEEILKFQTQIISSELVADHSKIKEVLEEEITKSSIDMEVLSQIQEFLESTNLKKPDIKKTFSIKKILFSTVFLDIVRLRDFVSVSSLRLALFLKCLLCDVDRDFKANIKFDKEKNLIPNVSLFIENLERMKDEELKTILAIFEKDVVEII